MALAAQASSPDRRPRRAGALAAQAPSPDGRARRTGRAGKPRAGLALTRESPGVLTDAGSRDHGSSRATESDEA
ncbi:hypothetical protein [Planctomycetes bacterium Poly30]|uniref:hypothetical protein n=1 Tax=Saltatorellus ferox TaxID=2528018 RepID=UPI0011A791C7